jgi:hypothetical protein
MMLDGRATSLLGTRPLAVFRQENRADSTGATLLEKFTRVHSVEETSLGTSFEWMFQGQL